MKRSKILIPTLSALALTPAIALTACNQVNVEDQILDAILKPVDLDAKEIDDFADSYSKLSDADKQKELIYDVFGLFNLDFGDDTTEKFNIHDLSVKDQEGGWKINITKCEVTKESDEYYASVLGYVSYVFAKQHIAKFTSTGQRYTFNANDYIMITFDFTKTKIILDENNQGFKLNHQYGSCLGFWKFRFESGKYEALQQISDVDTTNWKVKNSNNWIIKK